HGCQMTAAPRASTKRVCRPSLEISLKKRPGPWPHVSIGQTNFWTWRPLHGTWKLLFGGAFGKTGKVKGKPIRFLEACCKELASSLRSGNFCLGDKQSAEILAEDL